MIIEVTKRFFQYLVKKIAIAAYSRLGLEGPKKAPPLLKSLEAPTKAYE
jgi:hypothetical protein